MDEKIKYFVIILIAIVASVVTSYVTMLAFYPTDKPNSPIPTPTPTITPSPTSTPIPTPQTTPTTTQDGTPANLVCNVQSLGFVEDGGAYLNIRGDIGNTGGQTAYNVHLHIQTWYSDSTTGLDKIIRLNDETIWLNPFKQVDIRGGESYILKSRYFEGMILSVNVEGIDRYDLISSYTITPIWDDMS